MGHRLIIATDLDDSLVATNDKTFAALKRFNAVWEAQCASDSLLVYVTGRSKASFDILAASAPLLQPGVLICSVGTEFIVQSDDALSKIADAWAARLDEGWQRARLCALAASIAGLTAQQESEQRPHKISFTVPSASHGDAVVALLRQRLADEGESVLVIYSSGRDVDILPSSAGKGNAVRFLLEHLAAGQTELPRDARLASLAERALVCGDSGNDIDMLNLAAAGVSKGVVVANARPELQTWAAAHQSPSLYLATQTCADGILQAMVHFGFALQA